MAALLTVSQAARTLESQMGTAVTPRLLSDLFYQRRLPEELGPIVGGRRLISEEALPRIRDELLNVKQKRARRTRA